MVFGDFVRIFTNPAMSAHQFGDFRNYSAPDKFFTDCKPGCALILTAFCGGFGFVARCGLTSHADSPKDGCS
jgi:hypothetical protein